MKRSIPALHQELLTVMLAWLGNNKSICDWQSALVGEIIAKEYKRNTGIYLATNFRYNRARPDKNGNTKMLIERSKKIYEKWGLKTFICSEKEGKEEICTQNNDAREYILFSREQGLANDLGHAINAIIFYQDQGGGITTPFILSRSLKYVFKGDFDSAAFLPFSDKKLFNFSSSGQVYANSKAIQEEDFDLLLDNNIEIAINEYNENKP